MASAPFRPLAGKILLELRQPDGEPIAVMSPGELRRMEQRHGALGGVVVMVSVVGFDGRRVDVGTREAVLRDLEPARSAAAELAATKVAASW